MRALRTYRHLVMAWAVLAPAAAQGAPATWPQFRGRDANPVGTHARLPDRWSKTENVEWVTPIPGRGKSKAPQTGVDFSNDYVAELVKQGLGEAEIVARLTARDIELPHEVGT